MPELPEVERARAVIADHALGRRVAHIDDTDSYVCRPHPPGQIAGLLEGATITHAHRRGKSMWLEFDGDDRPALGIHLGMSGRIVVDGAVGGDPRFDHLDDLESAWTRFRITFADGGYLLLFDKRRLGRVVLDPDLSRLGPDVLDITRAEFRERIGAGSTHLKARLLDQHAIAGIGNLLADQTLWEAHLHPEHLTGTLDDTALDDLRRVLLRCTRAAMRRGGVHTGSLIPHRHPGGTCPRCGTALARATVGGRTTWWCPAEQR